MKAKTRPIPQREDVTLLVTNLAVYVMPPAIQMPSSSQLNSALNEQSHRSDSMSGSSYPSVSEHEDTEHSNNQHSNQSQSNDDKPKYFLVNTVYNRYALQDLLLLVLPYRTGISLHNTDYALRMDDFVLFLKGKMCVWLQSPLGQRSMFGEVISDAFLALTGHTVEMLQPDYAQLCEAILSQSIWQQIRQMQMEVRCCRLYYE